MAKNEAGTAIDVGQTDYVAEPKRVVGGWYWAAPVHYPASLDLFYVPEEEERSTYLSDNFNERFVCRMKYHQLVSLRQVVGSMRGTY